MPEVLREVEWESIFSFLQVNETPTISIREGCMKDNQRIFFLLFGFFVVVALGSLIALDGKGSAFDRSKKSMGSTTAVLSETTVIGDNSGAVAPKNTQTEEKEEAVIEVSFSEPETVVEEPVVEEAVEEITDEEPEQATEEVSEKATEEATEETTEEPQEYEVRYLMFKVNTQVTVLRLREGPSEDAEVKAKLGMQSVGYVLKPGNEWCKVYTASGKTGYCATEYLLMQEATIDDYPVKVRDQIEPPDEELNY